MNLIADRYQDNNDGTVTDVVTKLQWKKCSEGQEWNNQTCTNNPTKYKWDEAMNIKSNFANYSDWRLPTIEELRTLRYCSSEDQPFNDGKKELNGCKEGYTSPTIVTEMFPNTPADGFWSSSTYTYYNSYAWQLYFNYGNDYNNNKGNSYVVRLVRSI